MEIKEFKIRCSAISKIMGRIGLTDNQINEMKELKIRKKLSETNEAKPLTEKMEVTLMDLIFKHENPTLPETCSTYLEEWLKEQIYETRKEISSKYLSKGSEVEALAVDYYATERGLGFILQNIDHFENDYFTGTPDLILPNEVIEMKASWDCFTFPLFDNEPDKGYWMQANGYMHLTGRTKAKLVYTLQNTPEELEYNEPVSYDHLPSKLRIKEFEFDYDQEFINDVIERVKLCRIYIESLIMQIEAKP